MNQFMYAFIFLGAPQEAANKIMTAGRKKGSGKERGGKFIFDPHQYAAAAVYRLTQVAKPHPFPVSSISACTIGPIANERDRSRSLMCIRAIGCV